MALIVTTTLSSSSTTRTLGCSRIARRSLDRQRDQERRPTTNTAAYPHRPAVALHDALRYPEPEAGPFPWLRREERLEDLGEQVVRDALAGVLHLDLDGVAPEDLRFGARAGLRRDRDGPALRHRVRRVEQEVEEDLLELVRGCPDARQSRIELTLDLHPSLAEPLA